MTTILHPAAEGTAKQQRRAAQIPATALELTEDPVVVIGHPIASMNRDQAKESAQKSVKEIVFGLSISH